MLLKKGSVPILRLHPRLERMRITQTARLLDSL